MIHSLEKQPRRTVVLAALAAPNGDGWARSCPTTHSPAGQLCRPAGCSRGSPLFAGSGRMGLFADTSLRMQIS